jgi:hypothetical protein
LRPLDRNGAPSMGASLWGESPLWEYRPEIIMMQG